MKKFTDSKIRTMLVFSLLFIILMCIKDFRNDDLKDFRAELAHHEHVEVLQECSGAQEELNPVELIKDKASEMIKAKAQERFVEWITN